MIVGYTSYVNRIVLHELEDFKGVSWQWRSNHFSLAKWHCWIIASFCSLIVFQLFFELRMNVCFASLFVCVGFMSVREGLHWNRRAVQKPMERRDTSYAVPGEDLTPAHSSEH
jgi:hypothetical protein